MDVMAAMADTTLMWAARPPLFLSPMASPSSPSVLLSSAQNLSPFDVLLATSRGCSGAKSKLPGAGVPLRSKVCCARGSVGGDRRDDRKEPEILSAGELQYLGKFTVGCVAGAVLVKYGSLLVPSITRPNINLALLMISFPVFASIALLAIASILGSDWIRGRQ